MISLLNNSSQIPIMWLRFRVTVSFLMFISFTLKSLMRYSISSTTFLGSLNLTNLSIGPRMQNEHLNGHPLLVTMEPNGFFAFTREYLSLGRRCTAGKGRLSRSSTTAILLAATPLPFL